MQKNPRLYLGFRLDLTALYLIIESIIIDLNY